MSAGLFLESLNLRNFATFENQEIDFNEYFNGIVGETGSGKSLILDAFQLLLGARADKKLVRKGSECAIIEGSFKLRNQNLLHYFDQIGFPPEEESQIVIKRIIYSSGKSKSFLNHMSCPLSVLSNFSKTFVDMVGQFENQKLSNSDYQLQLLDQFSKNEKTLLSYQKDFDLYSKLLDEAQSLEIQLREKRQREDYLKFQLNELSELSPSKEREDHLIQLKHQLLNREALTQNIEELKSLSSEGETNILDMLKSAQKISNKISSVFSAETITQLNDAISLFEDFSYSLSKHDFENDEELSLDEIIEELDRYQKAKRKFNCESDELETIYQDIEKELGGLKELEMKLSSLKNDLNKREGTLHEAASLLHAARLKGKDDLEKQIGTGLNELNMEGATFNIQVQKLETLNPTGFTRVDFLAETNPGEGFYKIKEIASGGELSRILLCLRQIVASDDSINIFFFDEIDTGIGGETALKIAKALKKVSSKSQVLAITHLPQIAKEVDEIIFVAKKSFMKDKEQRTISYVENKKGKARKEVINTLAGL
jgi:DNA repair protein RecN (Recombination protein N)